MMELRKRPSPWRVDPDFVSSPPLLPPTKGAQKQATAQKLVEAAGAPRKGAMRAAVGIGCPVAGLHPATCGRQPPLRTSTRVLFRPRHPFNWYEPDMWTEVAKHLCGFDLLCLLADDSIWCYAFFRDLNLSDATPRVHGPLYRSWRYLYLAAFNGSHDFMFCQNAEHRSSWRIGSFVLDSPDMVLIERVPLSKWLPLDPEDEQLTIAILGACKLAMAGWLEIVNNKIVEAEPWLLKEELDTRKKCQEYGSVYFGSTSKVASDNAHGGSVVRLLFEKQNSGGSELKNPLWCLLSYLKEYDTHYTRFIISPSMHSQHLQPRTLSELLGEENCLALLRTDDAGKEMVLLMSLAFMQHCATSTGTSRASATRSSTRIANGRSIAENSAPSLKRITRKSVKRGVGDDEEEDGPGDGKGQPQSKDAGTYRLTTVKVSCVEELESLDPNSVRISISECATEEAASEIIREGDRRGFLFKKKRPYYKAVWACIAENTGSEEKDALDPDYQPIEEHEETGGDEEEAEAESTDVESSDVEDLDSSVMIEQSDCFECEEETEAEVGVEHEEANGSEPNEANDSPHHAFPFSADDHEEASGSELEETTYSPDQAPPFAAADFGFDPLPLEMVLPQPSGFPSPSVAIQDEHYDTAESHSPPPSPPSAPPSPASPVGPVALAIWMPTQDGDGEAPSSSDMGQPTAADVGHDTAEPEGNQGNYSPPPPPSPSAPPCPASSAGPVALRIWMPAGRPQYAARLAFATVTPAERAVNPSPFIRAALYASLPHLHYNLLPSSRGTMLLRFDGEVERDEAVECSPFHHDGGRVVLERAEETTNRYRVHLPWLAAISATDFPPEHWFAENIPAAFGCLGPVIEIDPDCVNGSDYSSVRVVVEVDREFLPPEMEMDMGATSPDWGSSVVHLRTLRVWDRRLQFDAAGNYIPFFTRIRTE